MKLESQIEICATLEQVWTGLHTPQLLKKAIRGCSDLQWAAPYKAPFEGPEDKILKAKFETQIGPIDIGLKGTLTLSDQVPFKSYNLVGQGSGLLVGKARGEAFVSLYEQNGGTLLKVEAAGQVSGMLAQIGNQLVAGAALKQLDIFLEKLKSLIEAQ